MQRSASEPGLGRKTAPYVSEPYGQSSTGGLMGPHPMSDARQLVTNDADIMQASFKHVLKLRKRPGANGMPSSQSLTYVPQERGSEAQDYDSLVSMKTDRRKHVRTAIYPQQKYVTPVSTSMEIGWLQHKLSYPDGGGRYGPGGWLSAPEHPRNSSKMTKYKDNMQLTGSYHILRFAK